MSEYQLRATFKSSNRAKEIAQSLTTALVAHADEYDHARDHSEEFKGAALSSFASQHGHALEGVKLRWGDDRLCNDMPEVGTLGKTLVFYHGFSKGGIGPELAAILTAAGASVVVDEGPPVLFASIQCTPALEEELRAFFAQVDEEEELSEWKGAPWQGGQEEYEDDGESTDIAFHVSGDRCAFTLPVQPGSFDALHDHLSAGSKHVSLRFARDEDVDAVNAGTWNAAKTTGFSPSGKKFLFTGKLASMSRAEAATRAKSLGASVASSVTKNLDVLVVGDEGSPLFGGGTKGSKQKKTEKLIESGAGILIMSETDFLKLEAGAAEVDPEPESRVVEQSASSGLTPSVTLVKKPGTLENYLTPYAAGSFGGELLLLTGMRIFASTDGKKFSLRQEGLVGLKGIFAGRKRAWGCGYGIVVSSADGFVTQVRVDGFAQEHRELDRDRIQLNAIAEDDEGVWTGGFEGEMFLAKDGTDFQPVPKKGKAQINTIVPTSLGTVVCRYNGEVNIAAKGKLKKTPLRARAPLYDACETKDGAVLIGGCNKEGGAIYRTTDFKEFELVSMPMNVRALGALPDGRIIAGGDDDVLAVSHDHGRSFEVLDHKFTDTGRGFSILIEHEKYLLATQMFQPLLRIE